VNEQGLHDLCHSHNGAAKEFPFGPETAVFKVAGKIFAISGVGAGPLTVSLKCEPELAQQLRAANPAITGGYHLNKRHWNTVTIDGSISDQMLADMIEDSYDLIVAALPKAKRMALEWTD